MVRKSASALPGDLKLLQEGAVFGDGDPLKSDIHNPPEDLLSLPRRDHRDPMNRVGDGVRLSLGDHVNHRPRCGESHRLRCRRSASASQASQRLP
jgi:hypothetical protein